MNYLLPIRLNNQGAELLSQGKIKEARVILIKALNLTKLITIEHRKIPHRNERPTIEYVWLSRMPLDTPPDTFVYQRPIQILEKKELAESKSLAADFTSAIVFNVSLGFHAQGLTSSRFLKKALHGYEISLELRKHRRRAPNRVLDLALLNNIAHVHVELSEYSSAKPYFQNVAYLLKHQNKKEMDAIELDGFTMGALWRQPSCAPVA
jgi:hypothetical protein